MEQRKPIKNKHTYGDPIVAIVSAIAGETPWGSNVTITKDKATVDFSKKTRDNLEANGIAYKPVPDKEGGDDNLRVTLNNTHDEMVSLIKILEVKKANEFVSSMQQALNKLKEKGLPEHDAQELTRNVMSIAAKKLGIETTPTLATAARTSLDYVRNTSFGEKKSR